jgi:hypothetical protein
MISKTAMVPLVKELRWQQVRDGLAQNPDLIGVRDKRGRTWLHLACAVDTSTRQPSAVRDTIRLAEILLDRGIDINDAAFTEENFRATPLWVCGCVREKCRVGSPLPPGEGAAQSAAGEGSI